MTIDSAISPLHAAAVAAFPRADLAGISTFAPHGTAELVELAGGEPGLLLAVNAEKLARGDRDIARLAALHLGYPDGIGAVIALRRKGIPARRIAGADLWLALIARYAGQKRIYLVGSTDAVVEEVVRRLRIDHPSIELDYRNGFLEEGDIGRLGVSLEHYGAELVFVAMGSPRQERAMERLYGAHPATYMGLGGSFDVYAGVKRRAPTWMQWIGMEWAFRILTEPGRIRRSPQLVKFAINLVAGRI